MGLPWAVASESWICFSSVDWLRRSASVTVSVRSVIPPNGTCHAADFRGCIPAAFFPRGRHVIEELKAVPTACENETIAGS